MKEFKVAIIGGGPGGYVSAIRLQQFGIEVAVFEKNRLGGVCLNRGCIPTKTMVKVAEIFSEIKVAKEFGIELQNPKLNYEQVCKRKDEVVEKLVSGVEFLFEKRQISNITEKVLKIIRTKENYEIVTKNENYKAKFVIIATGSEPKELPFMKFDDEKILSSSSLLELKKLPKQLTVIGGGVIGCEFASIFNSFGVKVDIVEFLPKLISLEDKEISLRLAMALKKSGIKIHLKTAVESYREKDEKIILKLNNGKEIITDKILISVGRIPTFDIETEKFQLKMEDNFIEIDNNMQTNMKNIFAIGDVTGKLMLAHTASKQGLLLAEKIKNILNNEKQDLALNYLNIPACIFTNPEIGSVGLTQQQAKTEYENILVGKFPFSANGKALGLGNTFGFVKTIADAKTRKILGMHIIGEQATELIAQGAMLLGTESTIEDVQKVIFAHPTLSETVMESIEDLENLAIHKM